VIARVISHLVIAPTNTRGSFLYELRELFPDNAVRVIFVSYYDYDQPGSLLARPPILILKNTVDQLFKSQLRHAATKACSNGAILDLSRVSFSTVLFAGSLF